MSINLTCPFCLGQAIPSEWAKEVDLLECRYCGRIWALEDHQKLWDKYQIDNDINQVPHQGKMVN